LEVGAALVASAEGYTPRANQLIDAARERLGTLQEVAHALADNLPAPKQPSGRSRRRRRRRRKKGQAAAQQVGQNGRPPQGASEQPAQPEPQAVEEP
jgi:hypothetical protein